MALWARGMGRDPMDSMDTALGRAFHDFWTNPSSMMRRGAGDMMGGDSEMRSWCPAIDVCDEPNRMVVHAELPGVKKQDIKLELHDDNIQICGETKHQAEYNRDNMQCSERRYGKFTRTIPLPKNVDGNHAKAKFEDGILCLEMPKKTEEHPKKIAIS